MSDPFPSYNCPSCGGAIELHAPDIRIAMCPHCGSGLFLEDKTVKNLGVQSTIADTPSLIKLFQPFHYQSKPYLPVGQVRFDYGRGFWDEWWVLEQKTGKGQWLSVDEGDYALEQPIAIDCLAAARQGATALRKQLQQKKTFSLQLPKQDKETVRVTELGEGVCLGFAGELPELLQLNERFDYAHLSGAQQRLYTVEISGDKISLFQGYWIDPFLIKV